MPFKSRAQEKWAHANNKPWAKESSKKTDHGKLPAKKGATKKTAGGKAKSRKRS
ncbi:hypothetical protein [Streptomyces sp. NPDC017260]|uniref:hypothetical protein n=1 Tax=unclassified Streptomyces TaxID=2593676 RepID=UPI00379DD613